MSDHLRTEINLRRLLSRCESMANEIASSQLPHPDTAQLHLRYRAYTSKLKQLLERLSQGLESSDNSKHMVSTSAMNEYRRKLLRLTDLVDDVKLLSPVDRTLSSANMFYTSTPHAAADPHTSNAESMSMNRTDERVREIRMRSRAKNNLKRQLLGQQGFEHALEVDDSKQVQDGDQQHMTDALVHMTLQMKRDALLMADLIQADTNLIQHTALPVMDRQNTRIGKLRQRTQELTRRLSQGCWMQLCLMLLVVWVFIFVYLVIRFVPKKQGQPVAVAVPSPTTTYSIMTTHQSGTSPTGTLGGIVSRIEL